MSRWSKVINSWGTYLGLIPFIVVVLYTLAKVGGSDARIHVMSLVPGIIAAFIVSGVVFIGLAILVSKGGDGK